MKKAQELIIEWRHGSWISTSPLAFNLAEQKCLGEKIKIKEAKVVYSPYEVFWLWKKNKARLIKNGKDLTEKQFLRLIHDKEFWLNWQVFKDLRERGYWVKSGAKFGAPFRVYKPGDKHSRWLVFPVYESKKLDLHQWISLNRVAHSTNKHLLLAVVDKEGDVIYYEISWIKP